MLNCKCIIEAATAQQTVVVKCGVRSVAIRNHGWKHNVPGK
jgi:hypothetical protein